MDLAETGGDCEITVLFPVHSLPIKRPEWRTIAIPGPFCPVQLAVLALAPSLPPPPRRPIAERALGVSSSGSASLVLKSSSDIHCCLRTTTSAGLERSSQSPPDSCYKYRVSSLTLRSTEYSKSPLRCLSCVWRPRAGAELPHAIVIRPVSMGITIALPQSTLACVSGLGHDGIVGSKVGSLSNSANSSALPTDSYPCALDAL